MLLDMSHNNLLLIHKLLSRLATLTINIIVQSPSCNRHIATRLIHHPLVLPSIVFDKRAIRGEQQVHLLERLAGNFWEDKPDDGHRDNVNASKNKECLPAEPFQHNGYDKPVAAAADGPAESREGVALSADLLGPDLGSVDPGWDNVEHGEAPEEDKDHGGGGETEGSALVRANGLELGAADKGGNEEERDALGYEGNLE